MSLRRKVSVRSFTQTNSAQRYIYHTSRWSIGGTPVTEGTKIGSLVLSIRAQQGSTLSLPIPFAEVNVWGSVGAFYEAKVPTFAALQQMLGGVLPTASQISIDMWLLGQFRPAGVTFSEVTSINGMV